MKRGNGEGSIAKTQTGSFRAVMMINYKRISKTFTTQRKAQKWLTEQKRLRDVGEYIEPSEQPLKEWLTEYVETYKSKMSNSSHVTYRASIARLPQELLEAPIGEITQPQIQRALNGIQRSRRTIEMTRTLLNMAFEKAVDLGMIRKNVVTKTDIAPVEPSKRERVLSADEETDLLLKLTRPIRVTASGAVDKKEQYSQSIKDALYFILKTGVSRDEALSLKWLDIGKTIHIKGTKNIHRNRKIPVSEDVRSMIDRRRFSKNSEYVFSTRTGSKIDGRNLYRWMHENTNHNVHDLRHTYITKAARIGVNPKVLQTLTGHSQIKTLLDVYTHVSDKDREDAAARIASGYPSVTPEAIKATK